jgi:hypothetical protein
VRSAVPNESNSPPSSLGQCIGEIAGFGGPEPLRLRGEELTVTIEAGDVSYLGRVHFKTWP